MLCLKRLVYSIIVTIILIAVTYFPVYAKDINSSSYKHESTSTVIKGSTEGNRIDNSPYKGMATEGVILENYKNTSIGRVAIYSSDNAVYDIHEDSKLITVMGENGDEIYFSAETLNAYDIGPYSAMLSGNWMAPKNSYYYYGFMYSPYESDLCNNNTAKTESVHYIPLLNENIKVWLLPKTTYYYVAYICNPSTYEYIYGNVKSFTTSDGVVDNIGNGFSNQMTKDNSKWFSWRPNVSGWYTFSADGPGEASICSSVLKTLNKNTSINDPIEVKYYLNADTDYYILFTPYTSRMFNFSITPSVLPDLINTQKFLTKPYSYQYFQFRPDTTDVYTLPFNESCTYKIYDNNMKFLFFLDSYNASSCSLQMLLIQDALYYIEMYSYISINAEVSIIKESDTTITADNQVSFTTDNTYENRYFSFTPEISGDYNLNVVGGSFALTLYDKNGKILTSPTSINDKLDLRYKLNGGEIYYYHIKNYTNSSFTLILTKCQVPVTDIEIIECTATVDTSGHVAGVSIIYEAPVGSCFSMGISCGTDTSCDGYSTTVSVPYSVKERDIIDFTFKHLNPNTTYYYTTTIVDSSAFYYGEVYSFTTGDSMSLTLNEGKAEKYFPLIDKNYYYNYTPSSDGIYSINLSALINDYSVLDRDNIQGHGTIYVRAKGDYYGVERNRTLDIPFYTYLKGGQTYYIEATILGFSVDKFVLTVKAYTPINLELDEIVRISSEGQYEYCYSYIPSVTGVYSFYDSTASIDIFNSETDYIMRNISQTDDTYQKRAFLISGRQYYIRLFVTHEDDYYLIVEKENRPSAGSVPVTVELDGWEYLRFYPEESGLYEITVSQCDTQTDPNPHISTKIITSNGDILYEKENSVKSLTTYYFLSEDTEYFIACYSNSTERYKVTATLPYALTADTTVSVDAKAFTESVYLFTPITNGIYSFKVNCSKGYLLLYNSDNILLDTKFSVDGNIQLPYSLISGVKYYCQFCSDFQGSYNLTVTDYKENVTNPKITVGSVSINISSGNEYRMFIPEKTGFYEISLSLINSDGDIASDATGVINADLLDQWGNTLYTSNSVGGDVTLICWLESGLNYYLKWNTEYSGILTITVTEPIELKLGVQINIITETDSDYYYYFTPPMSGCYNLSASDYIGSFTLYNADGIVTGPQNSSADKISYSYEYSIGEAYCFKFSLKSGSHAAIMLNYRIYTGSMNGMNGTIYTALYDDQGKMLETIRLNSSVLDYDDLPAEAARCKFFCLNEKWQPMCESEERIFERIIS